MSLIAITAIISVTSTGLRADSSSCHGTNITVPFTDVAGSIFFCAIAEAYFSGLTNGTSPTTYSPSAPVSRDQMAAFITRTLDQSLKRGSRRAALNQWHTPTSNFLQKRTQVGNQPLFVASDGYDLWVGNISSGTISRVRASDGKLLGTWTGATGVRGICVAGGHIYATSNGLSQDLYMIDPTQPPGPVTVASVQLPINGNGITTDGAYIWVTSQGYVSKITPDGLTAQHFSQLAARGGILYDGANIWVVSAEGDGGSGSILTKVNANGAVIQQVPVGDFAGFPIFDGTNIWVPSHEANSVTVVRAATGQVIATLTGNGLDGPIQAAFDGERVLVTNSDGDSVSLWRATDLTPLGSYAFLPNSSPNGACSDGINFWVTLPGADALARF
jgi:hypothetical protein